MVSLDKTFHLCPQPVMGNQSSRKASSSSISQSPVNIDPYKTPPGTPSDDEQSPLPPTTMSPRSRRPKCLRTAVFWELTDCRHYPPSPGTGLTLIGPVPYPYKPSPLPASFYGDDDNEDIEENDQIMTFNGTTSPRDPMILDQHTRPHLRRHERSPPRVPQRKRLPHHLLPFIQKTPPQNLSPFIFSKPIPPKPTTFSPSNISKPLPRQPIPSGPRNFHPSIPPPQRSRLILRHPPPLLSKRRSSGKKSAHQEYKDHPEICSLQTEGKVQG
ncbi:hypothetical protein D6D01_09306 [Aureobasidium pullulans]|uniref:Uncharacterized protein n=1 Tax=Aureobasidium pullulans TaxID=5580 RepID=A0A4S9K598_AURPU|nr:hypothetical protein D6D01_09306 [Aureobasidium pullulans]